MLRNLEPALLAMLMSDFGMSYSGDIVQFVSETKPNFLWLFLGPGVFHWVQKLVENSTLPSSVCLDLLVVFDWLFAVSP